MIHPVTWAFPSHRNGVVEEVFVGGDCEFINMTISEHFPRVPIECCYAVTFKRDYSGTTLVLVKDGLFDLDLRRVRLISSNKFSIIKKVVYDSVEPRCEFKHCHSSQQAKNVFRACNHPPTDAIYKNIHYVNSQKDYLEGTSIPVIYSTEPSSIQTLRKVVIPYAGPISVVVDDGRYGIYERSPWFELMPEETIEGAKSVFYTKLFRFIINHRTSQYSDVKNINLFPKLDLTRVWTTEELYNHFNLTQDEIEYIEQMF